MSPTIHQSFSPYPSTGSRAISHNVRQNSLPELLDVNNWQLITDKSSAEQTADCARPHACIMIVRKSILWVSWFASILVNCFYREVITIKWLANFLYQKLREFHTHLRQPSEPKKHLRPSLTWWGGGVDQQWEYCFVTTPLPPPSSGQDEDEHHLTFHSVPFSSRCPPTLKGEKRVGARRGLRKCTPWINFLN